MKKILITGITGFVGHHLAELFLTDKTYDVIGTYRSESSLDAFGEMKDRIAFKKLDLMDAEAVAELIGLEKPDVVFHLAAQSSPAISFKNPKDTIVNNIVAQLNLFEAIKNNNLLETRIIVVTTGEMYGLVNPSDIPVDEETPLRPVSPYSVSKISQDYLALQYFLSLHLDIVRVRPFNHIGAFQRPGFVVADFAKQIAEIEKRGNDTVMFVGNLEAKRDFTDVRDMVKAYKLVMEKGESGEVYNIGSGSSRKIADLLDTLLSFSTTKIEVKPDPEKFRPVDVPEIVCDNQKFVAVSGWKPEIAFEKTLQDILDYWRKIV
jgi:GDP-4-dehydro-6-deoxy-D-mannose reductase